MIEHYDLYSDNLIKLETLISKMFYNKYTMVKNYIFRINIIFVMIIIKYLI